MTSARPAKVTPVKLGRPAEFYPLDPGFERGVAGLVCSSPKFFSRIAAELDPERFSSSPARTLIKGAKAVYAETKRAPSPLIVLQRLRRMHDDGKLTWEDLNAANDYFEDAEAAGLPDPDAAFDQIKVPIKQGLVREAALKSAASIASLDVEAPMKLFRRIQALDEAPAPLPQSDADAFDAWAEQGPPERVLHSHVPSLNELFDVGGVEGGEIIVFMGSPGAAKTGLALDIVRRWARSGGDERPACVSVHAADEHAGRLRIRVAQSEGLARRDLILRDPGACRVMAKRWREAYADLVIEDATSRRPIEDTIEALVTRANGAPMVLVIDSIQKMQTRAKHADGDRRSAIDANLKIVEKLIKAHNITTIALSEVSRGAYSPKRENDQIDDLSAGKESGSIEYFADVLIMLRRKKKADPSDPTIIGAHVAKGRLGDRQGARFALKWDRVTATAQEVQVEEATPARTQGGGGVGRVQSADERRNQECDRRICSALTGAAKFKSANDLQKAVGGERKMLLARMRALMAEKRVVEGPDGCFEWRNVPACSGGSGSEVVPEPIQNHEAIGSSSGGSAAPTT